MCPEKCDDALVLISRIEGFRSWNSTFTQGNVGNYNLTFIAKLISVGLRFDENVNEWSILIAIHLIVRD